MTKLSDLIRPNITRVEPYVPGKPVEEVKRELGLTDIMKLASNENVLGPSERAKDAIRLAAESVYLYPDGGWFRLRQAIATKFGVSADAIICGTGSDEILHLLGLAFLNAGDEIVQADPTFVIYENQAALSDCVCHNVPLKDFRHDLEAMQARVNDRTKMVFLCSPNNPTGTIVTKSEADALLTDLPDHVITVFDEAYAEYVEDPNYPESLEYIREGRKVIMLRTFSKAYGLAGLRVGYGIASEEMVGYLNMVREPFNVNSLAQEAALVSIGDDEQVARSRAMNSAGKQQLYRGFKELGLRYVPTEANFIFVDTGRDSVEVFKALLKHGVIVRTGDIFGMPTFVRVTIATAEMNQRFLEALKGVLDEGVGKA